MPFNLFTHSKFSRWDIYIYIYIYIYSVVICLRLDIFFIFFTVSCSRPMFV